MERRGTTTIVTIGIRNRRQFNLAERTVFAGGRYFWSEIIAARTKLLAAISTAYQYAGCAKRRRFSVLSVPYSTAPAIRSRSLSLSLSLSPSPLSLLLLLCSPFSHLLSSLYSLPYSDNFKFIAVILECSTVRKLFPMHGRAHYTVHLIIVAGKVNYCFRRN